jgi:hypothetical protein
MRDIIEGSTRSWNVLTASPTARITIEATLGHSKVSKGQMAKNAKLFAVKENFNSLLDLARSTYQENVADINDCEYPLMCHCSDSRKWSALWKV